MACHLWKRALTAALPWAAGPAFAAAPALYVDFSAAVPSGIVHTGVPVELFATLKVTSPEELDRDALLLRCGFDPQVRWKARQGALQGPSPRVVLGTTTRPPNGLVFVSRITYVPPDLPGTYTVSATPSADPRRSVSLQITVQDLALELQPGAVILAPGQEQPFRATFQGPPETPLVWSTTGGTLRPDHVYRAPEEPGSYLVSVRHPASGRQVSARVTVANPFRVEPSSADLAMGQTLRFQAEGTQDWTVEEPGGGTVDATGTYRAPRRSGVFHIQALRPPLRARATVVVRPLVLSVSPRSSSLGMGEWLQFEAELSHGTCQWSADDGEITEDGLFHAPLRPGPCVVTARSTLDPGVSAKATVEIVNPGRLQIVPGEASLHVGQVQQFTALGLPAGAEATWMVQPVGAGSITQDGRFTAGPNAGPCSVLVMLDDMMSSAALRLIDTRILPDPARVRPGGTVPFQAQGFPGETPVRWSLQPPEAGTVSEDGLFTAGDRAGEARISAAAGGVEASATVSILTSRIVPEAALVAPGGTVRFSGETFGLESPALTWALVGEQPGASLDPEGTYRAPTLQGVYRVSATDATGHVSRAAVTVGPPKGLVVAPEVSILQDGIYTVRVRLRAGNGRTLDRSFTGEMRRGLAYPEVVFLAWEGLETLEADGPYALARVTVSGSAEGQPVVFDVRENLGSTEPFSLLESRREWIRIGDGLEARGQDRTEGGLFRTLAVSVPVEVASDGEYRVSGILATENGTELEACTRTWTWARGLRTAVLTFEGRRIRSPGPLSLLRFTVEGPASRVRDFHDAIKGFGPGMFEP